ncbi:calcium-dependent protein kinase CDPK2 [Cardiosporidium cionae]|uniref:Calcium-dependent protein kinase CDPK2 n=1 Tax=Cardiosporidium cionae TaxID=476202 RepID=A0ABQ7JAW3_9APIC|nr:calcium-dependent protein kinase CDPK2 [Cardiosporidium cionae]|eukprot:KAF8821136.1 calcium-dependent protein kinase CDPK2 [Cardiosporidium cionae]
MLQIIWQCNCPVTKLGDTVAVVGAHEQVGAWKPQCSVPLSTDSTLFPIWRSTSVTFNHSMLVEYKYIIFKANGEISWEPFCGNRVFRLDTAKSCIVENIWGIKEGFYLNLNFNSCLNKENCAGEFPQVLRPSVISCTSDWNSQPTVYEYIEQKTSTKSSVISRLSCVDDQQSDTTLQYTIHQFPSAKRSSERPKRGSVPNLSLLRLEHGDAAASKHSCSSSSTPSSSWNVLLPSKAEKGESNFASLIGCSSVAGSYRNRVFTTRHKNETSNGQLRRSYSIPFPVSQFVPQNRTSSSGCLEDYILETTIGTGSWGVVKLAREVSTGQSRAIKRIRKSPYVDRMRCIHREINIMYQLKHPNIVKLYDTLEDDEFLYLVMEYCAGGELFHRLTNGLAYSEVSACRTMWQILQAVSHCHGQCIAHRDLKPENFLFLNYNSDSPLKLIDFGLASKCDPKHLMKTKMGTAYYVSPEVIQGSQHGLACDMWSAGVILYLLLYGIPPFNGATDGEIFAKIADGRYEFPCNDNKNVSDYAKDLVDLLLVKDPSKRLTAKEALSHGWFSLMLDFDYPKDVLQRAALPYSPSNLNVLRCYLKLNPLVQLVLTIIALSIDDERHRCLRDAFRRYDTNKNYMLTRDTVRKVANECPVWIFEKNLSLEEIFSVLDPLENDLINYADFLAACLTRHEYTREELYRDAFHVIDCNKRGKFR